LCSKVAGREPLQNEREAGMNAELAHMLVKLRRLADEARSRFKAELIGVFGSVARGDQRRASDLDVLVRFLPGASLFEFVALADFLEEKLGRKVDIVSERAVRPELREQIMEELVRV